LDDSGLPAVSVLLPAHNYERFVGQALESALSQEYPADLLEIVVVDDGSTDGTAAVVEAIAASNPGRVNLIRQQNQGQVATIARARAEAHGELLAFLDADDVWLPAKTRKQVDAYLSAPNIGLVFADMRTIDADGRVLKESLYEPGEFVLDPLRLFARVMRTNVIYGGSTLYRADLFRQPPDWIESWDWWLAACVTQRQAAGELKVEFVPEPLALYRQHGDNMLLGASGSKFAALRRRQLTHHRMAVRTIDLSTLGPGDLLDVWSGSEWFAKTAMEAAGSHFVELLSVSDAERAEAMELRAQAVRAREANDLSREGQLLLRALATDPQAPGGPQLLQDAAARASAARRYDPLAGARRFVVLADAEELLAGDEMLREYAAKMDGTASVTLAVDASRLAPDEVVPELRSLIARCGLTDRSDIDVVAVVDRLDAAQRDAMRRVASAFYSRRPAAQSDAATAPTFTVEDLVGLRQLADSASELTS
jgi:hypothetical protein